MAKYLIRGTKAVGKVFGETVRLEHQAAAQVPYTGRKLGVRAKTRMERLRKIEEAKKSSSAQIDDDYDDELSWAEKILYNSYLQNFQPHRSFRDRIAERIFNTDLEVADMVNKTLINPAISCKYLDDSSLLINECDSSTQNIKPPIERDKSSSVHFPFKVFTKTQFQDDVQKDSGSSKEDISDASFQNKLLSETKKLEKAGLSLKTILDNKKEVSEDKTSSVYEDLGTADLNIPASDVPCGGCGAHLHCNEPSIPGYMPSEKFKVLKTEELREEICLRCFCLQNHQAALNVNISPDEYPEVLMKVQEHFAMVILLVDLTDFPCSIWPGIMEIIGTKRPVFLVGNKVDLLPRDSEKYLTHIEKCLVKSATDAGLNRAKIVHTALISAETGFGIENLITKLYTFWKTQGDIFILGCTNVGKSSLFNALIQSDMCKAQVTDMVQRATISQWPGTTLNLLKFPIMRADPWRIAMRNARLKIEKGAILAERNERAIFLRQTKNSQFETLIGHVGRTFISPEKEESAGNPLIVKDLFHVNPNSKEPPKISKIGQWDPTNPEVQGHWCFDTPGTVNENQILDILTLPELIKTLPKKLIKPKTFFIKLGMTMFVGGLARIDFIDGVKPIRYTVFSSDQVPITMVLTEDANLVYQKALGSPLLGVPEGNNERLSKFPTLQPTEFVLDGTGHDYSCGDIVLSSTGWVAVTVGIRQWCRLIVHTPNGKGVFCRQPSLLPYSVNFKGPRIRDTPAYLPHRVYMPNLHTR